MSHSSAGSDHVTRLARARLAAAEAGVVALLVPPGADLRYLSGYAAIPQERLTCLVVPVEGAPTLVVPLLDEQAAVSACAGGPITVVSWREDEDPSALVASLLPNADPVAIGDRMWAAQALALRDAMPDREQRLSGDILGSLRQVKDDAEVAALREAAAAIDAVFAQVGAWLRVGRSERAVASDVAAAVLRAGHVAIDCVIVGSGPNAALPHHQGSDRELRRGDVVVVDIAATMPSGYCSDTTRTFALGAPEPEVAAAYAVLRDAQEAAVNTVAVGVAAATIDAAARDVIHAAGYGESFTHRTGHGIGLETHEEPYIAAGNQVSLEAGMAFSVEPGIYVPGRFGARIEDIVVCGPDGGEPLNRRPRDLVVVDA